MRIAGPDQVLVGDRVQFGADVTFPDGRVEVVTHLSNWSNSRQDVLALIFSTAQAVALMPGETLVTATYQAGRAERLVRVVAREEPPPAPPPTSPTPPPTPPPTGPGLANVNGTYTITFTPVRNTCTGRSFRVAGSPHTLTISGVAADGTGGAAVLPLGASGDQRYAVTVVAGGGGLPDVTGRSSRDGFVYVLSVSLAADGRTLQGGEDITAQDGSCAAQYRVTGQKQ
ncbi:MAG: hypothetical protein AB1635_19275 [Acidobacteriota bacterium]